MNGYNLETGGNKNKQHSNLTKQKISKIQTGRKLTKEWKDNISRGNMGNICSDETKRKIGEKNKLTRRTPEENKRNSDWHKGKLPWNATKCIYKGVEYKSLSECARLNGIDRTNKKIIRQKIMA